jgi:hypothetical protein
MLWSGSRAPNLQWLNGGGNEDELVERERLEGISGRDQVADVGRIEAPT